MASKRKIVAPQASPGLKVSDLGGGTLTAPVDEMTPAHRRALARTDQRKEFVSISDRIAEDKMHVRGFKYNGADKAYPETIDAHMRTVTKMYPYARGGQLLVDEPRTEREVLNAYEKQKVLKKLGYRCVVIEPDSTLADALEQLGEL